LPSGFFCQETRIEIYWPIESRGLGALLVILKRRERSHKQLGGNATSDLDSIRNHILVQTLTPLLFGSIDTSEIFSTA